TDLANSLLIISHGLWLSPCPLASSSTFLFFCKDSASTEIYTLSLHDALPISASAASCISPSSRPPGMHPPPPRRGRMHPWWSRADRKSTRLNSSHVKISYAVFCLKKKKNNQRNRQLREPRTTLAT